MAHALAEKLGLPLLQAHYIPLTPTRAYPAFVAAGLPAGLGAVLNKPTYWAARQVLWQAFRPADRLARREVLGLRPAPFFGPFDGRCTQGLPTLYGYSPAVIPPPSDWPASAHVTGYWFPEPPADWTPPEALEDFLAAGPPPVFVGFGSMSSQNPGATARLVLDALGQAGQRGLMLAGWGGMQQSDLPPTVFALQGAPFSWLFPRVAAVVHHGGAGTTAAGLRAGRPSVVVPFFGDQPFWGRRVFELGAGPSPIPRRRLTAGKLAAAISRAVGDPGIRDRAAALGRTLRAEDGVGRAVEIIGSLTLGAPGMSPAPVQKSTVRA